MRDLYDRFGVRSIFATAQPELARNNQEFALGVLPKPYTDDDLINVMPVLARILAGGAPPPPAIPAALQLF